MDRDTGKGKGMVDISGKQSVRRMARARGFITLSATSIEAIRRGEVTKGEPLEVARVAALNAVKETARIVPHCHPVPIDEVKVEFEVFDEGVKVECMVGANYRTGVEMEALTGVSVALLTLWDMVKYLEKDETGQYPLTDISGIRVLEKIKGTGHGDDGRME